MRRPRPPADPAWVWMVLALAAIWIAADIAAGVFAVALSGRPS